MGARDLRTPDASEIRFWNVATGRLKRVLTQADLGQGQPLSRVSERSFSPNGQMLAVLGRYCAFVLDSSAGRCKLSLGPDSTEPVRSCL